MDESKLHVRIKVWVADDDGNVVFGSGRMRLLEAIDRTGSILQASDELGMSYRSAWGRLKVSEERLGEALVEKVPGGGRRGGSRLTPNGKRLLEKYHQLIAQVTQSSEATFGRLFLLDE
ncbi:MAG TPA: LysR family transcriptional regulator [bacterium]|nr:LysR family transcriptional regulator [bacterium]